MWKVNTVAKDVQEHHKVKSGIRIHEREGKGFFRNGAAGDLDLWMWTLKLAEPGCSHSPTV